MAMIERVPIRVQKMGIIHSHFHFQFIIIINIHSGIIPIFVNQIIVCIFIWKKSPEKILENTYKQKC